MCWGFLGKSLEPIPWCLCGGGGEGQYLPASSGAPLCALAPAVESLVGCEVIPWVPPEVYHSSYGEHYWVCGAEGGRKSQRDCGGLHITNGGWLWQALCCIPDCFSLLCVCVWGAGSRATGLTCSGGKGVLGPAPPCSAACLSSLVLLPN